MIAFENKWFRRERHLFYGLLLLLVWMPIPLGGNRPWAWALASFFALSLLAVVLIACSLGKLELPKIFTDMKAIVVLMLAWVGYQIYQTIPLPVEVVALISPAGYELHAKAFHEVPTSALPLSMDVGRTYQEIVKSSGYVAIFILTLVLVNTRERLRQLFFAITFAGTAVAVYGLYSILVSNFGLRGDVTGTYVNKNHFSAFIYMAMAAAIGLILASAQTVSSRRSRRRVMQWAPMFLDWQSYPFGYLAVMAFALLLSHSRGGIASMIAALSIVMILVHFSGKNKIKTDDGNRRHHLLWPMALPLLAGVVFLLFHLDGVQGDFARRIEIWRASQQLIGDFWLFGSGAGSFESLFPYYNSGIIEQVDHVHNDFLEILAEQGVIGILLLTSIVTLSLKNAVVSVLMHNSVRGNAFGIAALIGALAMLFHGLVDFNFHIPTNAAYFFVFMAVSVLQGAFWQRSADHRRVSRQRHLEQSMETPALAPPSNVKVRPALVEHMRDNTALPSGPDDAIYKGRRHPDPL